MWDYHAGAGVAPLAAAHEAVLSNSVKPINAISWPGFTSTLKPVQLVFDRKCCGRSLALATDSATGPNLLRATHSLGVCGFELEALP